jgi:2',3'-cyclic-nucleotide 2'-phosphodiesterase (5'-nucleotidase family)
MRVTRFPGRILLPALAAGLLFGAFSCTGESPEQAGQWVTILHTNDIHGKYRATPASWMDGNPPVGGFPAASDYVNRQRKEAERSLLLDAGDFMTGNPICDLEYEGVPGGGMIAFFNLLGYDAICLGNHDFDQTRTVTSELIQMAEMPVLLANLYDESGSLYTGKGYEIFTLGDVRVGVIGLVMESLPGYLRPGAIDGLRVVDEGEAIERILDEVDQKTDLIVLLTHLGVDYDEALAEQFRDRIDIIVGGHSHTRIEEPVKRNGIVICQAGSNNRYLGRLDVLVQADSVASFHGQLIPMWQSEAEPDPQVEALAVAFDQRIDEIYGEVIAELKDDWFGSSRGESNLGSWIADRMREKADTDVAVLNSGGIRKSLPKGWVKVLDIHEILPFDNILVQFECTGKDLLALAQLNAQAAADGGGMLQVSGIRYRWRRAPSGEAVVERVEVGGAPVDRDRTYTVASLDYTVGHADRYFGFEPEDVESLGVTVTGVIIEAVREAAVIESVVDGRMEEVQ